MKYSMQSLMVVVTLIAVVIGGRIEYLLVPALYVLSTGPALWLENHSYLAVGVVSTVYHPIALASESSETIDSALVWYWRLWT